MILSAHSGTAYLNISKARSQAEAHIMHSEDIPVPTFNGSILTISPIIKSLHQCQRNGPSTQLPCGNVMATNKISHSNRQHHSIGHSKQNHHYRENEIHGHTPVWWLCCHESQGQFHYYWGPGPTKHADYPTKAHPDIYHQSKKTHTHRLILLYFTILQQNNSTDFAHCKGVLRDSISSYDSHP
jgi:hypothetical protein